MYKKIMVILICFFVCSFSYASCSAAWSNQSAIATAKETMDTWFSAIEKKNIETVKNLFAPQFVILHSSGAPMTRTQEIKLLTGFHLGGYHLSDFCAMQTGNIIISTFASKTYDKDISKKNINFLSNEKAYRMMVMKKMHGKWKIIAYANTNPMKKS